MLKKRQDSHGGGAGRKDSAIHREDLEIPKSEIPIAGIEVQKFRPVAERKEERTRVSKTAGRTRCVLPREGSHRPLEGATARTQGHRSRD